MAAIQQSRQLVFSKMDGTIADPEPVVSKLDRISKFGTSKGINNGFSELLILIIPPPPLPHDGFRSPPSRSSF